MENQHRFSGALFGTILFLIAADYVTTLYGIHKGKAEANIVLVMVAENIGFFWTMTLVKAGNAAIVGVIIRRHRSYEKWLRSSLYACLIFIAIVYGVVVTQNIFVVI